MVLVSALVPKRLTTPRENPRHVARTHSRRARRRRRNASDGWRSRRALADERCCRGGPLAAPDGRFITARPCGPRTHRFRRFGVGSRGADMFDSLAGARPERWLGESSAHRRDWRRHRRRRHGRRAIPAIWRSEGSAVARWSDGEPAAVEHVVGEGCIRDVGIWSTRRATLRFALRSDDSLPNCWARVGGARRASAERLACAAPVGSGRSRRPIVTDCERRIRRGGRRGCRVRLTASDRGVALRRRNGGRAT